MFELPPAAAAASIMIHYMQLNLLLEPNPAAMYKEKIVKTANEGPSGQFHIFQIKYCPTWMGVISSFECKDVS